MVMTYDIVSSIPDLTHIFIYIKNYDYNFLNSLKILLVVPLFIINVRCLSFMNLQLERFERGYYRYMEVYEFSTDEYDNLNKEEEEEDEQRSSKEYEYCSHSSKHVHDNHRCSHHRKNKKRYERHSKSSSKKK